MSKLQKNYVRTDELDEATLVEVTDEKLVTIYDVSLKQEKKVLNSVYAEYINNKVDTILEAPEDGELYGRKDADWEVVPKPNLGIGWSNYLNGDTTPIALPAGVETKLTLTTVGGSEREDYLPLGVSGLWDSTNSQFDFSSLEVGDMVDIRVDGSLTTTTINDSFAVILVAAIGSAGEFVLPFASGNRFIAGTNSVSRYNGIFIGSEDVRDNPSELRGIASDDASGFLIDIYVKVLKPTNTP